MGCEHTDLFQKEEWDGTIKLWKPGEEFYTGLLGPMVSIFDDCKVVYKILDRRQKTFCNFPELEFVKPSWYVEREYQDFTISRGIERTRGIFNIGTGGGKTVLVTELIARLKVKPFMFYVLTKDLLYQAKECLSQCLNCEIGQIGDGIVDIKDINVCTKDAVVYAINKNNSTFNIQKYKFDSCDVWDEKEMYGETNVEKIVELVKNCRGLYFDEVHHASSSTCRDIILASPRAYWRYGGTATLEREDGEELVIQGLFGKRIVNISLSYLIKNKWLVPAGVFFVPVEFKNMPYTSYQEIYSHGVSKNEELIDSVAELSQYLSTLEKSSLILVSKITHGKIIKSKIPGAKLLTGKDSSKKRNQVISDMKTGKLKILIATTLADEGLDIPKLDVVHMMGAGASVTRVPQRIGRVVRKYPEKKYGIAIYYHYCTKYLYQHGLKAKRIVKQEPELEVIQTSDVTELRSKILDFMNRKESLFSLL
jgi:superfamily II DNA or RNA helicase